MVEYNYNSWGEQTGCAGTLSTALGILNPFRYRGYVYDEETGLYYLQSRYYDPDLCRFISADVFLSTGQGVLGCNAFAYCANEPVSFFDDSGAQSRPIDPTCAGSSDTAGIIFMLTTAGVSSVILPFIESCVNYLTDRVDEMATVLKKSAEAVKKETMTHRNQSVYVMYYASGENAGKVGYVGRTNDPIRRKSEHERDKRKDNLGEFTVVKTNMTKTGARFFEQALISAYSLQSLDNKIRGIARKKSGQFVAERQRFDLFYGYFESEVLSLFER